MKKEIENYKGIEFVRISALPEDQKRLIWHSFDTQKIIKILRDDELLNDCLRYNDYQEWYLQCFKIESTEEAPKKVAKALKLAFK